MHLDALLKDLGPKTAIVMEFNDDGTTNWSDSTAVCHNDGDEAPYDISNKPQLALLDQRLAG